ncbi:hypothetical protein D3C78_1667380 [compost metagenome]
MQLDAGVQAFEDAGDGLSMALVSTANDAVEGQLAGGTVLPEPACLLYAQRRQLVVVGGTEGGLGVADKQDFSHGDGSSAESICTIGWRAASAQFIC